MTDQPTLGPLVGTGKEAEVFAWGSGVLKLYRRPERKEAAFDEAAVLALAESFGLPAPRVRGVDQVDGRWGIAMTRVDGAAFGEAMLGEPGHIAGYLAAMASLHARLHRHSGARLGGMKARLADNIARAGGLGDARRRNLLDGLAALPDGDRLCHGDFHPWNILGAIGEETIVDWLDACRGVPAADVCRSFVLMRPHVPDLASDYVDAYANHAGVTRADVLIWLPFVAAGRLAEGVADETGALMEMIESG
jgi:Ser/Thr protein kinase RdoA (MazF antagonist)